MKKLFLLSTVASSLMFADMIISPDQLPQTVKDFINTHYKGVNILKVEKDWDSYEVKLNNGVELDFTTSGELKELDSGYNGVPDSVMPDITAKAKESQKGAKLMEIEKEWNGYELKFSNNYKVYIDKAGNVKHTVLED